MRSIAALLLCLLPGLALAQDPATSQPYGAPLYLNPAFAGYEGCSRVALSYRNQWPEISLANFQTVQFSYDQYVRQLWGGIGVTFLYDDAFGIEESMAASVIYAPTFKLFKGKLVISPSTEIGWAYRRANTLDIYSYGFYPRTGQMINYFELPWPPEDRTRNLVDFAFGLLLAHQGFTYGFAVHHLTEPDDGYFGAKRLPRRLTGHISYLGRFNEKVSLMPSFIYMNQEDFHTFLPTLSLNLWGSRIGGGLRATDKKIESVIVQAGYARKWFSVGYSCDITVSSIGINSTGGSHEVNLQFRFNCRNKEVGRKGDSMWGM